MILPPLLLAFYILLQKSLTLAFLPPAPSIPPLRYRPLDFLRSTAHILNSCIPSGHTIHGLSAPIQCPCTVQLSLYSRILTSLPSVKLFVVPHSNPRHILYTLQANSSSPHTNTVQVPDNARLAIVFHTTGAMRSPMDCMTQVHFSFDTSRQMCPVALPLELGVPNPMNHTKSVTPKIVGGHTPPDELRSHMAAFINGSNFFVCSGSVIGRRYVLTAAHCPIGVDFEVGIGGDTAGDGRRLGVEWVKTHPDYDASQQEILNDIALVKLKSDVPPGTVFLKVSTNDSVPVDRSYVRASGYGRTGTSNGGRGLRQVDVPVVAMDLCRRYYGKMNPRIGFRLNEELQLCAGLRRGGCDACQGDSGGPLIVFDGEGEMVQVGIVSFGIGCAEPELPGVYTKLSPFAEWIRENGAEFEGTGEAVAVFTAESPDSAGVGVDDEGFQLFGLSEMSTIVLICGVVVAFVAVIFTSVAVLRVRIGKRRRQVEDGTGSDGGEEQSDPPDNITEDSSWYRYARHDAGVNVGSARGGGHSMMQLSGYEADGNSVAGLGGTPIYDPDRFGSSGFVMDNRHGT
eukprot:GFKZ01014127.1.p1 GENE.GFKZ01014127.1~~GFKZ01014127.1.p1  ORF type:complete len:569 (+),score=55.07 GFKZ01014127.1:311-2017(+)